LVEPLRRIPSEQVIAVAVDAGTSAAVALVADFTGEWLCRPFSFALNRSGVAELVARVQAVTAARQALPAADAPVVREAIGWDLTLLAELDRQVTHVDDQLARGCCPTPRTRC
jgi:N-acetylglucosamine kinase-like BadF-type ATPase